MARNNRKDEKIEKPGPGGKKNKLRCAGSSAFIYPDKGGDLKVSPDGKHVP